MVELQRDSAPMYRGDALDPNGVLVKAPKGLKAMENDDRYRNMSRRQLAAAMGFNSLDTVRDAWKGFLCFAVLLWATVSNAQVPPYLSPGFSFTNGQLVTAAQLNALVANATIGYNFYASSTGETLLGNADKFLVLTTGNQYRVITAANAFLNNTNQYLNAPQETNISTNALVLIFDGATSGTGQLWRWQATNWAAAALILQPQTNWDNAVIFAAYDTNTGVSYSYSWPYIGSNWNRWLSFTNTTANTNIVTNATPHDADLFAQLDSANASNKVVTWQNLKNGITNASVVADARNLKIVSDSYTNGSPVDATLFLTADEVLLKSTNGATYLYTNVNVTLNCFDWSSGPGAQLPTAPWGGADTNSSSSTFLTSQWYYVWLISDGTNNGAILSTNWRVPIFPNTNVTFSAMVGAEFADANGFFRPSVQLDRQAWIYGTNVWTGIIGAGYSRMIMTNSDGTTTNQSTNFNQLVPVIARTVTGNAGLNDNATDGGIYLSGGNALLGVGDTNCPGQVRIIGAHTTTVFDGFTMSSQFSIPVQRTSSNVVIWWKSSKNTITNAVNITGYGL